MPDPANPPTPSPASTSPEGSEPTPEQAEEKYWKTFEERLNSWFDNKIREVRQVSPSRMGRTTLPQVLADMVFGKPKE